MSFSAQRHFALDIADRLGRLAPISVVRFFGGVGLRSDGAQFAFVMKGSLYLRVDAKARRALEAMGGIPFAYAGASGTVIVASYVQAPALLLEDDRELNRWATEAHRVALAAKPAAKTLRH